MQSQNSIYTFMYVLQKNNTITKTYSGIHTQILECQFGDPAYSFVLLFLFSTALRFVCYLPSFLQLVSSFITISNFMWNGDDMISYNNRIHPRIKCSDIYNPSQMLIIYIYSDLYTYALIQSINIQFGYPKHQSSKK